MKIAHVGLLAFSLSAAGLIGTVAPAAGATHTWSFGDGSVYEITLLGDAQIEQVSPPDDTVHQAFTIRMPDEGGVSTIAYQLMVMRAGTADEWADLEKVDAFLQEAGQRGLQGSVETEIHPVHLEMANGVAGYNVFTDASLAGKTIDRPGEFRHMVMLAGRVGDFTLVGRGYTNSTDSDYFKAMNRMIESSRIIAPE